MSKQACTLPIKFVCTNLQYVTIFFDYVDIIVLLIVFIIKNGVSELSLPTPFIIKQIK